MKDRKKTFAAAAYIFPALATAGKPGQWLITMRLDERLPAGSRIRVALPRHSDWARPQVKNPGRPEHWSARVVQGEYLDAAVPKSKNPREVSVVFTTSVPLDETYAIQIQIGGLAMATPQTFWQKRLQVTIQVARPGDEGFVPIHECPTIEVVGGDATSLKLIAPSVVAPDEEFSVLVRAQDAFANPSSRYDGTVDVGGPHAVTFTPADRGVRRAGGLRVQSPGVHRVSGRDEKNNLTAKSNPIMCESAPEYRIYWGYIHGHTELSDGLGTAEEYFRYARDSCALDFCALGDHDHDHGLTDDGWDLTRHVTDIFNRPGSFVTLLGYEWAKWRRNGDGDKCVYFPGDHETIYRSGDPRYDTPAKLFAALPKGEALVIPHHTACVGNHCDWKDHDPEFERLVEIYSVWGNSERSVKDGNPMPVNLPRNDESKYLFYIPKSAGEVAVGFVQNALKMGCRLGFTAGGDDHIGHPGDDTRYPTLRFKYKAGLTAVYARSLTREEIWRALWERRCYATTGARMILQFGLGDRMMGAEIPLDSDLRSERRLTCRAVGEQPLQKIEIVRNGEDVHTHEAASDDESFEWMDTSPFDEIALASRFHDGQRFIFYYMRVTQQDGELAWASPIWIVETKNG